MNDGFQATEDELQDWVPPELIERARVAAERDAASRQQQQKKQPRRRQKAERKSHRGLAAVMLGLSIALLLAGVVTRLLAEGKQRGRLAAHIAVAVLTVLVQIKLLLPMKKFSHRKALLVLLPLNLAAIYTAYAWALRTVSPPAENRTSWLVMSIILTVAMAALSPTLWLLFGVARGKRTERLAAVMAFVLLGIQLLSRAMAVTDVLGYVQSAAFALALLAWPVTQTPVLQTQTKKGDRV